MLTATPKAKSPRPRRRSWRYSSNRAHCASVGGTKLLVGVGRATCVVVAEVAVGTSVMLDVDPLVTVDGAAVAAGDPGFESVLAPASDVVGVAPRGREAAHAEAPVVISRAATTDTERCHLAEIMGHHHRGRWPQLRLTPIAFRATAPRGRRCPCRTR
jgi:hypothetical protein